jgi:hypothetical protein
VGTLSPCTCIGITIQRAGAEDSRCPGQTWDKFRRPPYLVHGKHVDLQAVFMGGQDSNLGLTDYELPNLGDLACI